MTDIKPLTRQQREQFEETTELFTQTFNQLDPTHPAITLLSDRGITPEVAAYMRLGLVGADAPPGYEGFIGRMSIPNILLDSTNCERVVGQKFRALSHKGKDDERPKFLYAPGVNRMYNIRALRQADKLLVVTEGESCCWAATAAGFWAVGIPGAQYFGKTGSRRLRLLEGYGQVVLVRDNDKAGEELAQAMASVDGLTVVTPDRHKDLGELFAAEGPQAARLLIEGKQGNDPDAI